MCQRLALIGEQQHDVTGSCLGLAQCQTQSDAMDRIRDLPA